MALPAPQAPAPQPGLLLYVSLPEGTTRSPADLAEVAEVLREFAAELLPGADTYTALSLAPAGSDDVHRLGDRMSHLQLVSPPTESPARRTAGPCLPWVACASRSQVATDRSPDSSPGS